MTAWHRDHLVGFDLETTGADPNYARIVTATIVDITPDGAKLTEWLINPGIPIPQGASDIHGITTERAAEDGQDPESAVFEITGQLALALGRGIPVVVFNAAYDFTVLDRECWRQRIDSLTRRMGEVAPIIDPHVIDKHCDTYRKGKRTLTAVCAHYGVRLDGAHNASADALGAARAAFSLAERYEEIRVPVMDLHQLQKTWRAEQSASLQAYFAKQGKPELVDGGWPVQAVPPRWKPTHLEQPEQAIA